VSVDQLMSNDLISIENDQVLLPYILANSQYEATTTENGSEHRIVYRIATLEKQVIRLTHPCSSFYSFLSRPLFFTLS